MASTMYEPAHKTTNWAMYLMKFRSFCRFRLMLRRMSGKILLNCGRCGYIRHIRRLLTTISVCCTVIKKHTTFDICYADLKPITPRLTHHSGASIVGVSSKQSVAMTQSVDGDVPLVMSVYFRSRLVPSASKRLYWVIFER